MGFSDIIGGSLLGGGAAAGMYGQDITQSRQAAASKAERKRQRAFQSQAQAISDAAIARSGVADAQNQINASAANRSAEFNRVTGLVSPTVAAPGNAGVPGSPSNIAAAQNDASTAAWNKILGNAQAQLGGYHDWELQQHVANQTANQNLGVITNLAKGSADASAAKQAQLAHSGDLMQTVGGLVQSAGSLALMGAFL